MCSNFIAQRNRKLNHRESGRRLIHSGGNSQGQVTPALKRPVLSVGRLRSPCCAPLFETQHTMYASEVGRLVGIAGSGTDCPY
jgi:hypothetical protein